MNLHGAPLRNVESTPPSLLSVLQTSPSSLLPIPQTSPSINPLRQPIVNSVSLNEPSSLSIPKDTNVRGLSNIRDERIPQATLNIQQPHFQTANIKKVYDLEVPKGKTRLSSLNSNASQRASISDFDSCTLVSPHANMFSNPLDDDDDSSHVIDGACATSDFKSECLFNVTTIESPTDSKRVASGMESYLEEDQCVRNLKSFDNETADNVVTEYTTIVVGKVLSPEENTRRNKDEKETIYASIEHVDETSPNTISYQQCSLRSPSLDAQDESNKDFFSVDVNDRTNYHECSLNSPSRDIQKEFEKDFFSVENVLFNNEEPNDVDETSRLDTKTKVLGDSDGVRITLNFEGDTGSSVIRYDNEFVQGVNCQDETDCDLEILETSNSRRTETDPPNRSITILGPTETVNGTTREASQPILTIGNQEDNNAVILEIDTSTSVI